MELLQVEQSSALQRGISMASQQEGTQHVVDAADPGRAVGQADSTQGIHPESSANVIASVPGPDGVESVAASAPLTALELDLTAATSEKAQLEARVHELQVLRPNQP